MKRTLSVLAGSAGALAVVIAMTVAPAGAHTVDDSLPGGTSFSVAIDAPVDEAVLPAGQVNVSGTAAVGEGVAVANTALVYVLDVSGSTAATVPGGCGGGAGDDVLDCEIAAAQALNADAITAQTIGAVGGVVFATTAAAADVTPAGGDDPITGPATDDNSNAVPDIEEVLGSASNNPGEVSLFTSRPSVGGGTNFAEGIVDATSVATDPANGMDRTVVAFMSDGFGGGDVPGALAGVPGDVDIFTFAVGSGSECGSLGSNTSLEFIADETGGVCTEVPDVTQLPDILPGVIASELTELTLEVNGGAAMPITNVTPTLPEDGPVSVNYSVDTGALSAGVHELCVTASGSDAGGGGSVTDCHEITINGAPEVDPGGPYAGQEGGGVSVAGSVVDPDSPGVTTEWSIDPLSGVDSGTTCEFGDDSALSTTVACTDDGEFEVTLTAEDGVNPPVAETTTLTLSNVAPEVNITAPEDEVLVAVGTTVDVIAPFTDDGANDTHTCTVDFDDGSPPVDGEVDQEPGAGTCTTDHTFTTAGSHQVLVTVTDDDRDSATDVVTVVAHLPGEAFAISASGVLTVPKTPHATCPPDESLTQAGLDVAIASVDVLNADCVVDPQSGATTASASVDGASLLGGVITIGNIESDCVSDASGVTRTSNVGTINGTPIGSASGSITIPLVAQVFFNETTTGPDGELVQNAVRVQTILGQQIILGSCALG